MNSSSHVSAWLGRIGLIAILTLLGACDSLHTKTAAVKPAEPQPAVTADLVGAASQALIQGRPGEALDQYQRILAMDPKNVEAELGMGEALLALNDAEKARDAFSSVASDPRLGARALQGRGFAELAQNHLDEAAVDLNSAVAADPKLWRAWNGLGMIHDLKHEWAPARAAYEKALPNAPKSGIVHNNIGFSFLVQKNYAAAAEEFRAALREVPGLETAQNNLRLALAFQGRYREALAEVSRESRAAQLNNVGYAALLRKDYGAAESYFSQAMDASPSYYDTAAQNLSRLKALEGQASSTKP
jgi:Flp pilus assembly protein TadD